MTLSRDSARQIALAGIFTALAFGLSFVERVLPIEIIAPLPGLKIGLANAVTLVAFYFFKKRTVAQIVLVRCVLAGLLFGMGSLPYALTGAFLSFAVMAAVYNRKSISFLGVSVSGAAAHNTGQIIAAFFIFRSVFVFAYLPILLIFSVFTGAVTGFLSGLVVSRLKRAWNSEF